MAGHKSVTKTTTFHERVEIKLDRQAVLDVLRASFFQDVPDDATITITVPGGADWSNTDLDVDNETPLVIAYATSTTAEG